MLEHYVDSRETVGRKSAAKARNYLVIQLEIGDYMAGSTVIEYKEDDFMLFDGRLKSQLEEMKQSGMRGFLVVGRTLEYVLNEAIDRGLGKMFVYGMVGSLCDTGFPPIFCGTFLNAIEIIDKILEKTNDGKDRSSTYVPFRKLVGKRDYKMRLLTSFSGMSITRVDQLINSPFDFDIFSMIRQDFILPYIYDCFDDDSIHAFGIGGMRAVMSEILKVIEDIDTTHVRLILGDEFKLKGESKDDKDGEKEAPVGDSVDSDVGNALEREQDVGVFNGKISDEKDDIDLG